MNINTLEDLKCHVETLYPPEETEDLVGAAALMKTREGIDKQFQERKEKIPGQGYYFITCMAPLNFDDLPEDLRKDYTASFEIKGYHFDDNGDVVEKTRKISTDGKTRHSTYTFKNGKQKHIDEPIELDALDR